MCFRRRTGKSIDCPISRNVVAIFIYNNCRNRFRNLCVCFVNQKWFDNVILLFIALNCITLAMERPNIPPNCPERVFLGTANYVFTAVFTLEMVVKVCAREHFGIMDFQAQLNRVSLL